MTPCCTRIFPALLTLTVLACADVPEEPETDLTPLAQSFDYRAHQAAIDAKYAALDQGAKNALGAPLRGAQACENTRHTNCSYQQFAGGRIYYMPDREHPEAYAMYGAIYGTWWDSGKYHSRSSSQGAQAERQTGIPATDERGTPDGRGRYVFFRHANVKAIYWTPQTGAVPVPTWIEWHWRQTGWERGPWGYPVRGWAQNDGRCGASIDFSMQDFEGGTVCVDTISDRAWLIPYPR